MFINVNKKYDFDNLSDSDFIDLIEEKIKKEKEKIIKNWVEDKITIEKGRWGKIFIIKGKKKVQIPKAVDPKSIDLEQAKKFLKK
jgi:DNA topoisomerase-1